MEKLETNAARRLISQLIGQALDGLRFQRHRGVSKANSRCGRADALPLEKMNRSAKPDPAAQGVWYNAAMRDISYRRGL